jgi:ech hydrogenase subunit D
MSEPQKIIAIDKNDLVGLVAQYSAEGYRLVQIGCSTLESAYELNYSFDKDYAFINLRIIAAPDEALPSISLMYPNAFLYENEIHDLFGVTINNISIDYHGTLYQTAIKTPFSVENVQLPEPPKPAAPKPADAANPPSEAAEGQHAIKE